MLLLFPGLRISIVTGLVCALLAGFAVSGARAQGVTAAEAVKGAISGTKDGLKVLRQYLSQSSGRSEEMEGRANELIKALAKSDVSYDLGALQDAITAISDAARQSLFATPIARVKVMDDFRLSPRAKGYDFGPPDSNVMANFEHVTAKDKRLGGANRRALRRPSSDQLLSDGVVNVEKFVTQVPNGKYRVVLMTDNLGIGKKYTNPLGKRININGNATNIAQNQPSNWLNEGYLSSDGSKVGAPQDREGSGGAADANSIAGLGEDGPPSAGMMHRVIAKVQGTLKAKTRDLTINDKVYSDEKINTGPGSAARLIFRDSTVLSIGANSSVVLDKFVFDPTGSKSQVSLSLTKGAMRFVSGDLSKDRYSIRTPVATMGIRGTIFEVTVAGDGTTTTSVIQGAVAVRGAGKTREIKSGFSTKVRRGRPPSPPRANPPRPPRVKALRTALGPEPAVTGGAAVGGPPAAKDDAGTTAPNAAAATIGGDPAAGTPPAGTGKETGIGGMVIVEVEVVDSKLVIDFDKLEDRSIYLTAIIVEPLDEKSNLALGDEVKNHYQNDRESLVAADAKIDEQIGTVLSEIATAAGPEQVAEALGIKKAAIEPTVSASPN